MANENVFTTLGASNHAKEKREKGYTGKPVIKWIN